MISLVLLCLVFATIGGANGRDYRTVQRVQGMDTVMVGNGAFRAVYGPAPYDVLQRAARSDDVADPARVAAGYLRAQRPAQQPRGVAVDGGARQDVQGPERAPPTPGQEEPREGDQGAQDSREAAQAAPETGDGLDDALPAASEPVAALPAATPTAKVVPDARGTAYEAQQPSQDNDAVFGMGYVDQGGSRALLAHFVDDVLPCEGGPSYRDDYGNGYRTRAQFSADTWAKINAAIGPLDGANPYDVGRAVAWWVRAIGAENVASRSGWPSCGQ